MLKNESNIDKSRKVNLAKDQSIQKRTKGNMIVGPTVVHFAIMQKL